MIISFKEKIKLYLITTLGLIYFLSYNAQAEINLDFNFPEKYTIEKISVKGNKYTDANLIISVSRLQLGSKILIPGSDISNAIQNIWDHGIVDNVNIYAKEIPSTTNIEIIIEVVELPRLKSFDYSGVTKKEKDALQEKLKLIEGKCVSKDYINEVKSIVHKYFIEEGYYSTVVTINKKLLSEDDNNEEPIDQDNENTEENGDKLNIDNSVTLQIIVDKGDEKLIGKISFIGNKIISEEELRGSMNHIREKAKFSLVKNICKSIVTLKFFGKNGPLLRPFNPEELIQYLKDNVIFTSSNYDEKKFDEDKLQIINYYRSKGFRDAKILDTQFFTRKGNSSLNMKIFVYEGEQYTIGNITWVGNTLYSSEFLQKILGAKPDSIYDPITIKDRLSQFMIDDSVASLYYNTGYLHYGAMAIETKVQDKVVNLEIRVREGYQSTIDRILVKGNKITHDNIILREIRTLPGDKFNGNKLKRSYRQLVMLNIFDPNIEILPLPNPKNKTADISYKIKKETPKFEFKAIATFGSGGPEGGFTVVCNNASIGNIFKWRKPLGDKQDFAIDAKCGAFDTKEEKWINSYSIATRFADPMISEKYPIGISWGTHFTRAPTYGFENSKGEVVEEEDIESNKSREKKIIARNESYGTNIAIGKGISWIDYASFRIGAAYDYSLYYGKVSLLGKKEKIEGTIQDLRFDFAIVRDSTDNPIFPTEGSILNIQFITTPPYSLFSNSITPKYENKPEITEFKFKEYNQTMIDFSLFVPVIGKLVFNTRINAGLLGSYQKIIGPFERFRMGGTTDYTNSHNGTLGSEFIGLRGYQDGKICPEDSFTNYKGGVLYDKLALELRYPILTLSSIVHLSVLTFLEAGNTWSEYKNFSILNTMRSAGFGIRLYVGVMLNTTLGLDFGYPLDKQGTKENEMVAQFSMGVSLIR